MLLHDAAGVGLQLLQGAQLFVLAFGALCSHSTGILSVLYSILTACAYVCLEEEIKCFRL